jgi:hypothetical protein
MIKVFDSPEYMTVEEVKERFYPFRVVLVNCDLRSYAPIAGYVAAMETIPDDDYDELSDYRNDLCRSDVNGVVHMVLTRKPLEGEWLRVEFAQPEYSRF